MVRKVGIPCGRCRKKSKKHAARTLVGEGGSEDSAQLGPPPARLGSARARARLGSARLGSRSARLGPARPGWVRPGVRNKLLPPHRAINRTPPCICLHSLLRLLFPQAHHTHSNGNPQGGRPKQLLLTMWAACG